MTRASTARRRRKSTRNDDGLRDAWDEAQARYRPPIRRDAARTALLRVLRIAAKTDSKTTDAQKIRAVQQIRHEAETLLLVVESGGTALARRRARKQWLAFARRRLRHGEPLRDLAEMMSSIGLERVPAELSPAFERAWASERLSELAVRQRGEVDARSPIDRVPTDPTKADRLAREAYRRGRWTHAAACARVADVKHKTATTREAARLVLLAALHHADARDDALLRDTIDAWASLAKRGRKVWMFDWRSLAALAILHEVDDDALQTLCNAWRTADPTFAATALLGEGIRKEEGE